MTDDANSDGHASHDAYSREALRRKGRNSVRKRGGLLEIEPVAPAPYWASISVKKGFRRLHRTGGCWVKPGVDCAQWEGIFSLDENAADASCKLCWPPVVPASDSEGSDESSSSDDS